MVDLTFTIDARGATTPLTLAIDQAVIAGWTGRDPVARDKHIAELEAIGIARPATTPIYYRVSARRLTTADSIEVSGGNSSGEVEFVLIGWQGRIFVGLGSDHTDRKVETYSVTVSKQMCDKVMAPVLWELEDVAGHWDQMILRSFAWIGGTRVCTRKVRSTACCRPENWFSAASETGNCPMAAPCSAAPSRQRAASALPAGSSTSWRTRFSSAASGTPMT